MKFSEEIRVGYMFSLFSPFLVTFCIALLLAVWSAFEKSLLPDIGDFFGAFFGAFFLFGFFSMLVSSIFCGIVGIPMYYLLRWLGLANGFVISAIGALVAYSYAQYSNENEFFTALFVLYGTSSGFFFWLGSRKARDIEKSELSTY